jgi:hypothetical protein
MPSNRITKHARPLYSLQGKGKQNECIIVYNYLKKHLATASMVAAVTGIEQKNICRYKRTLEKAGQLWQVKEALCKKTGHKAWYLTTDPDLAPDLPNQLILF